jgi:MscS family membrane protein
MPAMLALVLLLPVAAHTLGGQAFPRQDTAQPGGTPSPDSAAQADASVRAEPGSPRASIGGFVAAARDGDFARAAHWLDPLSPDVGRRGETLAQRLTAVLDTHLALDTASLSPLAVGDTSDGLHPDREQLGEIADRAGRVHPIYLARRVASGEPRWVFAGSAIPLIDLLYEELPDGWVRAHLPRALLGAGPFGILWWQWLGLVTLIVVAAAIGWLLAKPTQWLFKKAVAGTATEFDDALAASAAGPFALLWAIAAARVLLHWIALGPTAMGFIVDLQRAIAVIAVFWIFLRAIGVMQDVLPRSDWATRNPSLRTLIPFGGRIARVVVFAFGLLTVVATFGYPIATILAGLGIGGIAVALGAQKSLEHFFGSVSIGVDQPFRVGDWVSVAGISGSVEEIGLRSTRIRTLGRTLVSIPNGVLAETQSENFGQRDRFALHTTIGVEYGTSVATLRLVRDRIREMLLAHPKLWGGKAGVSFVNFGGSSLDVEILCWLSVADMDEFKLVREEIFLRVMEIVEAAGASFAFPSQTLYIKR